jgi:hypothetical protein
VLSEAIPNQKFSTVASLLLGNLCQSLGEYFWTDVDVVDLFKLGCSHTLTSNLGRDWPIAKVYEVTLRNAG